MSNKPDRRTRLRRYIHNVWDIRGDMMSHAALSEMMEENTIIHGSNMWILMLAILIASIGLNVNSTAVIIGAMLISPLMSGILTMGYSLATSDLTMLRRALLRFGTQVMISLITSTAYFLISPLTVPTSEMIARTTPTLWDVLIALFGGMAGMIGNTRQKKGNVIPGVAIATALMPPLCTAGYGIATWQLKFMLGAFYLFLINTLFIMLSAALVTKLLGVPTHASADPRKQRHIKHVVTVITIITVIPSILVGLVTVYSTVVERNVQNYITTEFAFPNTKVVLQSSDRMTQTISVSLVGETISPDTIQKLEQALPSYNLEGYKLQVTQNTITVAEGSDADKITIAVQENTIHNLEQQLAEEQKKREELEKNPNRIDCAEIAEHTEKIFTRLTECRCGVMQGGRGEYILLTANSDAPLSEEETQTIRNYLVTESGLTAAELMITTPSEPLSPEESTDHETTED